MMHFPHGWQSNHRARKRIHILYGELAKYSLRFKIKLTFGHKLSYEIKVTFGEISLKLCQMN
jgi:hypothetical protein